MTTDSLSSLYLRASRPALMVVAWTGLSLTALGETGTILQFDRQATGENPASSGASLKSNSRVQAASMNSAIPASGRKPASTRNEPFASDPRKLAPPPNGRAETLGPSVGKPSLSSAAADLLKLESLSTASAGLAIVLGLFLACMWLSRKTSPRASSALPGEAVAVLGRISLAPRNTAHLLQVGNKLVLISLTPEGATPLAEVTDPDEVQRLLAVCMRGEKQSTTAQFQHVLDKLAREPARGFLGKEGLG